tara:strand:- start:96 stop:554 length:459 start_codon:yes stop_codon:yes gene_type:complete
MVIMFAVKNVARYFALVLTIGLSTSAFGGHKMHANDLELDVENAEVVADGKYWFARRCAFCHGGDGIGGKGPCLTCGKFSYSANTNVDIMTTISVGIPLNRGGSMGAFGTTMPAEAIIAVVTFMRAEEARRIQAGEIEDPYATKEEAMVFPD